MWDCFEHVIPLLEDEFHVIIPAMPSYDESQPDLDFSSMEDITKQLSDWPLCKGHEDVDLLYGCSMGGAMVFRMFVAKR